MEMTTAWVDVKAPSVDKCDNNNKGNTNDCGITDGDGVVIDVGHVDNVDVSAGTGDVRGNQKGEILCLAFLKPHKCQNR